MNFVIDIIIIGIILLCVFLGYKKGLIGTAFSLASFIVAGLVALILFNPVANVIMKNTELDENIKNTIIKNFSSETPEKDDTDNFPDVVMKYIEEKTVEVKNTGIEAIADGISETSIKVISFVGLFIIARIALIIIEKIADLIAKLPVIKQFNEVGGIIVGAIKGILIIYIIFAILTLILPLIHDQTISNAINSSFIGKFVYNNNLLLKLLF